MQPARSNPRTTPLRSDESAGRKVLLAINGTDFGGTETLLLQLAVGLGRRGFKHEDDAHSFDDVPSRIRLVPDRALTAQHVPEFLKTGRRVGAQWHKASLRCELAKPFISRVCQHLGAHSHPCLSRFCIQGGVEQFGSLAEVLYSGSDLRQVVQPHQQPR